MAEPSPGLAGIPDLPWESLSHRQVLAELASGEWVPCGVGDVHIFRGADRPVLMDIFCMAGAGLYDAIIEDVAGVHRRIPRERMRCALDIPYLARENSTAEILALRTAWARAAE